MFDKDTIHSDIDIISVPNGSLYDSGYIPGNSKDPSVEWVAFSGGGMSAAAFAGVFQDMESRGLYKPKKSLVNQQWVFDPLDSFYFEQKKIKYWLGSSAGAIFATLGALGAPSDYIINLLLNTDARIFLDYGGRESNSSWWHKIGNYRYGITDLLSKWGIVRGLKFKQWFAEQMIILGWDPEITFSSLYNLTGQHLIITATSLNTSETLYLSRSSYPYMRILDANDISIRLPYLFPPVFMNDPSITQGNRILTDGGILDDLPINACDVMSNTGEILAFNRKAIGFTLINDGKWVPEYVNIDGLLKYSLTFIKSMHTRMHAIQSSQPYFWDRVIPIETYGVGTVDFDLDKGRLNQIVESGRNAAKRFFDNRDTMILENGPLPENLFIPNPRLKNNGINYLSDDLIENSYCYCINHNGSAWNKLPIERCFSC